MAAPFRPEHLTQYTVERSDGGPDDRWDDFVDRVPGGHHAQTTLWAEAKRVAGWTASRLSVVAGGELVAGCQVLVRRLPVLGAMAFVPRGPLALAGHGPAADVLLDALELETRRAGCGHLKVQPPVGVDGVAGDLQVRRFTASPVAGLPTATVRIDLRQPLDSLLATMRSGVRNYIRKAERQGVVVRAGTDNDVNALSQLVAATVERKGFRPYPPSYYATLWRVFASRGNARMVVAEFEGRPIAGALIVGWGDTAAYKMGAWAGEPRGVHPNELVQWSAIRWAHQRGFRWYDLDGIDPRAAEALLRGETIPEARSGFTHFKLGFGGAVTMLPGAYDKTFRPLHAAGLWVLRSPVGRSTWLADRVSGRVA